MAKTTKQVKGLSSSDIEFLYIRGLDIRQRVIYLNSPKPNVSGEENIIDAAIADLFERNLHLLLSQDRKRKLTVVMNVSGGDDGNGWKIYDAIRGSPAKVDIIVKGSAFSMGTVILQAGDKRILDPNAQLMVHDGELDGSVGTLRDTRSYLDLLLKKCDKMYNIFAERSGRTREYWAGKCQGDFYMTAEMAIKEGLADKVMPPTRRLPSPRI